MCGGAHTRLDESAASRVRLEKSYRIQLARIVARQALHGVPEPHGIRVQDDYTVAAFSQYADALEHPATLLLAGVSEHQRLVVTDMWHDLRLVCEEHTVEVVLVFVPSVQGILKGL